MILALALALALAVAGEVWYYVASCFAEIAEGFLEVGPVGVFVVFQLIGVSALRCQALA